MTHTGGGKLTSSTDISPHPGGEPGEHPVGFVFWAVRSLVSTQQYKRHWPELNNKEICVCPASIAVVFDEIISLAVEEMAMLRRKNRNLRTTRDLLLPKLISGRLDVDDLDIDVGEQIEEFEEATA